MQNICVRFYVFRTVNYKLQFSVLCTLVEWYNFGRTCCLTTLLSEDSNLEEFLVNVPIHPALLLYTYFRFNALYLCAIVLTTYVRREYHVLFTPPCQECK